MENEEILKREKILHTALKLAVTDLNKTWELCNGKNKYIKAYIEDYIQQAEILLIDEESNYESNNK